MVRQQCGRKRARRQASLCKTNRVGVAQKRGRDDSSGCSAHGAQLIEIRLEKTVFCPDALLPVNRSLSCVVLSAACTMYVDDVAPRISVQAPQLTGQRCH